MSTNLTNVFKKSTQGNKTIDKNPKPFDSAEKWVSSAMNATYTKLEFTDLSQLSSEWTGNPDKNRNGVDKTLFKLIPGYEDDDEDDKPIPFVDTYDCCSVGSNMSRGSSKSTRSKGSTNLKECTTSCSTKSRCKKIKTYKIELNEEEY